MTKLNLNDLRDAEDRFVFGDCVGAGVFGKVYKVSDTANGDQHIAIKIQKFSKENEHYISEEFKVLKDFSDHFNLPDFYGAFKKEREQVTEVWFAMEFCEGGPVIDLVNGLLEKNRRMSEDHISFVLKEVVKAVAYLHKNHIMHRDIKGSNILMAHEGDIKLVDFGLSRHLSNTLGRTDTCIGSPSWMAPEVVTSTSDFSEDGYGNRADVWAIGITAIELGDGKTPFCGMHPSRALFQIVRNPPPTLQRPGNWSGMYNDFLSECLVKNPEYRPYMGELLEHPFLTSVPENNYHLTQELKSLRLSVLEGGVVSFEHNEDFVKSSMLTKRIDSKPEKMVIEDLAALDHITEESILKELEIRMESGHFQTFIGDILLVLNPNEHQNIYGEKYHCKYKSKSRSDNAPHIYAIADSAYQDALHHLIPQNIILSGESNSGKTTCYLHLVDHLLYLGANININMERIKNGIRLIQAFTQASTPLNEDSTRCIMKTEVIYGRTGKVSGCTFSIYQLEKLRVSSADQPNFHIFYYLAEGLSKSNRLQKYGLEGDHKYRYLRVDNKHLEKKDSSVKNFHRFEEIEKVLSNYEFSDVQIETIYSCLTAILLVGELKFIELENETAALETENTVCKIAELLKVDGKKLCWALVNYCYVSKGTAIRKHHTCEEAENARDMLANVLYARLVDYMINVINHKLSYGRAIFGEKYSIRILDMFGLECFKQNSFSQLLINTLNEQLHYLYLQRVFAWEALELNEEGIPYDPIRYYDNKGTLEGILGKGGLLTMIDDSTKNDHDDKYIIDSLKRSEATNITNVNVREFAISHYTGKIYYQVKDVANDNRDFLPPEIIDVLRTSENSLIKTFFTNKLNKTGNINVSFDEKTVKEQNKFSSSSSDEEKAYSQIKKMRTASSTFKAICLELMKELAVGGGSGGTHFIRCIRSDLEGKPKNFHTEIVKQQIRAMALVETARSRQRGYPHRIIFSEFLRRYKFLAFEFDENVETTRDNCRLLMVRLKMEGWVIGKTKVFLKYYNEEYLARLYETHVKKIIKIQCMMRGYLAKRKIAKRIKQDKQRAIAQLKRQSTIDRMTQEEAAVIIQKAYRGLSVRKTHRPLACRFTGVLDEETRDFIKPFAEKWKNKSLFQVILQYRAAKYHHSFNFSQQVHFFNQKAVHSLHLVNKPIDSNFVEPKAQESTWLLEIQPPVFKLPIRLDDIPYFDTAYMRDPLVNVTVPGASGVPWDSPFERRDNLSSQIMASLMDSKEHPSFQYVKNQEVDLLIKTNADKLINLPYNRDPAVPVRKLPSALLVEENSVKKVIQKSTPLSQTSPISSSIASENEKNLEMVAIKNRIWEAPPTKHDDVKMVNPIAELKNMARRENASDDEPPFNFQGMLKKTNITRASLKRAINKLQSDSRRASKDLQDKRNKLKQTNFKKVEAENAVNLKMIRFEVAPGIIVEGLASDL